MTETAPPVTETETETSLFTESETLTVEHTAAPVTRLKTVEKTVVRTPAAVTVVRTATVVKAPDPVTVTADPPSASSSFGAGTQIVGVDVQPGTYRAPGGESCYWQRLKGASGSLDDIIANDVATVRPVVTIAAGDFSFDSSDCGQWTKIG